MNYKISTNKATLSIILIGLAAIVVGLLSDWGRSFFPQSLNSLAGNWQVTERLNSKKISSEIDWQYTADILDSNVLRLSGRKVKVNKKEPSKREKTDILVYNCKLKGRQSDCKFDELNSTNPILGGEAKLEFKDTFESFSGRAYENGMQVSTLDGYRQ